MSPSAENPPHRPIVRTVTAFTSTATANALRSARTRADRLRDCGYEVQSIRACFEDASFSEAESLVERLLKDEGAVAEESQFVSVGGLSTAEARDHLAEYCETKHTSFHVDLTEGVSPSDVDVLFDLMEHKPERTFGFSWVFNNPPSSPFFNASRFSEPGFAVGLQTPNLSEGCSSLEQWFDRQAIVFRQVVNLFAADPAFLGLDSSAAPMDDGAGSLVGFLTSIASEFDSATFSELCTTDVFTNVTQRLLADNPKPVGLCGLMLPCLEDHSLAAEYDAGNFSIERNLFLSLHSGLGIDTYPIGHNQDPARVFQILQLVRALSNKHNKPTACRFVADDSATIGERTQFVSPYLTDVTVRPL